MAWRLCRGALVGQITNLLTDTSRGFWTSALDADIEQNFLQFRGRQRRPECVHYSLWSSAISRFSTRFKTSSRFSGFDSPARLCSIAI